MPSARGVRKPLGLSVGRIRRGRSWGTGPGCRKESGGPSCGTRWRVRDSHSQLWVKRGSEEGSFGSQVTMGENERVPWESKTIC